MDKFEKELAKYDKLPLHRAERLVQGVRQNVLSAVYEMWQKKRQDRPVRFLPDSQYLLELALTPSFSRPIPPSFSVFALACLWGARMWRVDPARRETAHRIRV